MDKFALSIPPKDDELMISYLARLAMVNQSSSLSVFLTTYMNKRNNNVSIAKQNYGNFRLDCNDQFSSFFEATPAIIDRVAFYLEHSSYPALAPFLSSGMQTAYINDAFRRKGRFEQLQPPLTSTIKSLKICPECRKEELKKTGQFYYHRKHNLPGVNVCLIHGCALEEYNGNKNHILDEDAVFTPLLTGNLAWEGLYADYCGKLLDIAIDSNLKDTAKAVLKHLRAIQKTNPEFDKLNKAIESLGIRQFKYQDIDDFIEHGLWNRAYVDIPSVITVCLLIYPDPEVLKGSIQRSEKTRDDLNSFVQLLGGKYNVFNPLRTTILEMENADSHERFVTTPYGFMMGWREETADKKLSDEEKFRQIFENLNDGTYELLDDYRGNSDVVRVKHTACGRIYTARPRSLMLDRVRCSCEQKISFEEAKKKVEAHSGFHLIEFNGYDNTCRIHHDECGNDFECWYSKFIKFPNCRCCSKNTYDIQTYRKKVKDLTGNEYTVMCDHDLHAVDKVKFRHNDCGKVFECRANRFLIGQRCPDCRPFFRENEAKKIVYSLSAGRYRLLEKLKDNTYQIQDTTDDLVKTFSLDYILQELSRPTPSRDLPLEVKGTQVGTEYRDDRLLAYLKERYDLNELIFLEDIRMFDMEYPLIKSGLNSLFKKGKICKLYKGIYSLEVTELTPERYFNERYILRNGRRIGFMNGESLAFSLGIIDQEPDLLHITTNKESGSHGRTLKFEDGQAKVKGDSWHINDHNYLYLEVLDILKQRFHFGWSKRKVTFALRRLIAENNLSYQGFLPYLDGAPKHMQSDFEELMRVIYEAEDRKAES
ncbi:MAG: TniQ family protein [Allobaculum sp.]